MPITGQESTLAAALTTEIKAAVSAQFGGPIGTPEYIEAVSMGIANALIPFLVANTQVDPGQVVPGAGLVDSVTSAAITGATATSTPGTIS